MSSERKSAIRKHVSDMLGAERHILEAIERQRSDDKARDHVQANKVLIEIERVLKQHVSKLEALADEYGSKGQSTLKKALTTVFGAAAGMYDQVREHPLSRDFRDNYTALGLASMSYTAMHTFGLVVQEKKIADLALNHLKDLTPLMVEISKVLPRITAEEVDRQNDFPVDESVVEQAVRSTQDAWRPEVTKQGTS